MANDPGATGDEQCRRQRFAKLGDLCDRAVGERFEDDAHADPNQVVDLGGGFDERSRWSVRAKVDNIEAPVGQQIGDHRGRQRVGVASDRTDDNGAAASSRMSKERSELADDAIRCRGCTVLGSDGDFAVGPAFANANQRRVQEPMVDFAWRGTTAERIGHEIPAAANITGEQTSFERLDEHFAWCARRPAHADFVAGGIDRCLFDPPLATALDRVHAAGAHVAIRGHVVNAELVSSIGERDQLFR